MSERPATLDRELVFLSHAVDRSGPPIYLRHLLRWIHERTPVVPWVASLEGGDLAGEVGALARLHVTGEPGPVRASRLRRAATEARDRWRGRPLRPVPPDALVYVNTAWSVRALRYLPHHRGPVIAHIHELEVGLSYHLSPEDRAVLLGRPVHWVAASRAVADNLVERWAVPSDRITVHHEMIDTGALVQVPEHEARRQRDQLGVPPGAPLIGTAAVLNWRKAPDLFVELAARAIRSAPELDARFAWVGADLASPAAAALRRELRRAGIADRVHLVGASDRPEAWMRAFDLFVLPAREDAFPLACLEAAAAGRPIVCFDAGGMPEFVRTDAGVVVPYPDVAALAAAAVQLAGDPARRAAMGATAQARVVADHDARVAAPRLWEDVARWGRST